MKIRQQAQIQAFLVETFGTERGNTLFAAQEKVLYNLTGHMEHKSPSQQKTLVQTILPRIALYQALAANGFSKEETYACLRTYMLDTVAAKKHASTAKMEWVPGFYAIYSRVFLKIMATTDLQENTRRCGRDFFDVTITKCLWHTACVENGCPELCRLFCDVDNVTYGGLKKLGFSRTQTLGYGGKCCDFHFFKK